MIRKAVLTGAFFPVAHHAAVQRSIHPTYSTKKSLLFETDFSARTVNIFLTSQLSSGDPTPVATITEPTGGCPYDMALDKKKTNVKPEACEHFSRQRLGLSNFIFMMRKNEVTPTHMNIEMFAQ